MDAVPAHVLTSPARPEVSQVSIRDFCEYSIVSVKSQRDVTNGYSIFGLQDQWPSDALQWSVELAAACIDADPKRRPKMEAVARALEIILQVSRADVAPYVCGFDLVRGVRFGA
jgi:hypothetical protein